MAVINIRPQVLDLMLYAGDGIEFRLICTDSTDEPVDINGVVKAQIKSDRTSGSPSIVEFSVSTVDAYQGIIVLSLAGAKTQELMQHSSVSQGIFTGVWDVEWNPANAEPRTLCQGAVECVADVSR